MGPSERDLQQARRRFAADIAGACGPELEQAFADVRREDFLPPPPWIIYRHGAALATSDPESLYDDVLVAIDERKGINNGQPSLHVQWLSAVEPWPGDRVLHVGCGGGYYTAILAALVGAGGHVVAYEIEPCVAALAKRALAQFPNVEVHEGSGAAGPFAQADVIYVNAAARAPERSWIEALAPGGRLIFPWRYGGDGEVATLIVRSTSPQHLRFAAQALGGVQFIGLKAGSQAGSKAQVGSSDYAKALRVRELVLHTQAAPDEGLVADFGWAWFST